MSSAEQLNNWFQSCAHVQECCLQRVDGLQGSYLLALQRDKPETPDGLSLKFSVMEITPENLLQRGV